MLRFAIFFCIVLFAYAADASEWSVAVSVVQSVVQEKINAVVHKIQIQQIATQRQNIKIARTISNTATNFSLQAAEEIYLIGSEISKLTDKAKGVNISGCFQYHHDFNVTAKHVLLNMSTCFAQKLRIGLDQIVSISQLIKNEFAKLIAIKEEAQHCCDNIDDSESLGAAVLCIKGAGMKASSSTPSFVEELTAKNTALKSLFKRFEPLLADCRTTNGLATFHQESSTVMERTNICIQQKIAEALTITTNNHQ